MGCAWCCSGFANQRQPNCNCLHPEEVKIRTEPDHATIVFGFEYLKKKKLLTLQVKLNSNMKVKVLGGGQTF